MLCPKRGMWQHIMNHEACLANVRHMCNSCSQNRLAWTFFTVTVAATWRLQEFVTEADVRVQHLQTLDSFNPVQLAAFVSDRMPVELVYKCIYSSLRLLCIEIFWQCAICL